MNALRNALMLAILFGAGLTITPPAPVAANDCDSTIDCLIDTVPPTPPGPCGIIQIESCRCLTHIGACGIAVPDPCDVGDCGCVTPQHVNSDDLRVCGFSVNPCDWLQDTGSTNPCACVNVPTTTTFGRAPSGSGSCGIALPSGPGDDRPDPCEGLPEDACGCISISNTLPGVALSAVSDYVCGVPTNPCALVGSGTLADGCGCVEMNGPQRLSLVGLFAATTITSTGIIPTSICGIPTDPCASSSLGAMACECVAQLERELPPGRDGDGGSTLLPFVNQRIVTPPAICFVGDVGCMAANEPMQTPPPQPNGYGRGGFLSGHADYSIGFIANATLPCLGFNEWASPFVVAEADLGGLAPPFEEPYLVTNELCSGSVGSGGFTYAFSLAIDVHDAAYYGRVLTYMNSSVVFDINETQFTGGASGGGTTWEGCEGARLAAIATTASSLKTQAANYVASRDWPLTGTLRYIMDANGGWYLQLPGSGTGHLSYTATLASSLLTIGGTAFDWTAKWTAYQNCPVDQGSQRRVCIRAVIEGAGESIL